MARKAEGDARRYEQQDFGKGVYRVEGACTNCDWKGSVQVTRGRLTPTDVECPRCGCSTVQPTSGEGWTRPMSK